MRIALDYSSSSASTSDVESNPDQEEEENDRKSEQSSQSINNILPNYLSQQQTLNKFKNPRDDLSRTPSSTSLSLLMGNGEPSEFRSFDQKGRKTSNLDRVNAARQLAKNVQRTRPRSNRRRSGTPSWMQDSPGVKLNDEEETGDETILVRLSSSENESEYDSEEEAWPVAPKYYSNQRSRQKDLLRRQEREASVEAKELSQRIRLESEALSSYRALPIRNPTQIRSTSRQLSASLSPNAVRSSLRIIEDDFDKIQNLLSEMRIEKKREEAKETQAFEERNKALWTTIEASIRHAEDIQAKAEREEQEKQRKIKEQQEEAERREKERKEAEEARLKKEKESMEKQKKEEEERKKAEEQVAAQRAAEEAKEKSLGGVGNSLAANAKADYEKWWDKIQHIKQTILPAVSQNSDWRKQCFSAKRIITRSVGQLTNSRVEIVRITQTIGDVMIQAKGASPGGEIYTWILNHLSKCLIRQAEQEVAAKQDTAFPLARVVQWLLLEGHTELGDVLMARLAKKCCWCLAYCPAKKPGQDEKEYAKILGKAEIDESSLQYTSRMSGIIALFFAICQTTPSSPPSNKSVEMDKIPNHLRLSALWIWQARMISPKMMEHTITPALFSILIEIAGQQVLQGFGKQTTKLWILLKNEGLQNQKAGFTKQQSANSARVRLELLLEDWAKNGKVIGATEGREMAA